MYGVFYSNWPEASFFIAQVFSFVVGFFVSVRELVCFNQVLIPCSLLCNGLWAPIWSNST